MEKEEQGGFEVIKLIPNAITMSALCLGLFAVRLSIVGDFQAATNCIIVSCLLDAVDGRVARKLNASSEFGAQMDSLADFFNFGVAPGFLMYFWRMEQYDTMKRIAWFPVLILAVCMAIRLARFNVDLVTENCDSPLNKYFFKGVPAPMAAALVLFPIVIHFEFPQLTFFSSPLFIIVNTTIVAFMAGSTIPTPCLKKMKFKSAYKQLALMFVAIMLIGLLVKTWLTAIFICCFYITTILIGWFYYYKFSRANKG